MVLKSFKETTEMIRETLTSAVLRSAGWQAGKLEVEFNTGQVWQYQDVPEGVFKELMNAASAGQYFQANIRNQFKGVKL
jgi:lysyl-tRNA synthetase class 2